jgi:membrane protease YdiL (CAAX protease family)
MTQPAPAFTPLGAITVLSVAFASFIVAGAVAVAAGAPQLAALAVGDVMLVAVPIGACVLTHRPAAALGLTRPRARLLVAALLIGASAWLVNLWLVSLLPLHEHQVSELVTLVERPSLPTVLAGIVLMPAICEELLFRGVVLRGLATRFIPVAAIALSAALFSAYHLSVAQAVPTFTLGLALGLLVQRGGSIVPSVLAHLLNNAIAVLVQRDAMPGGSWLMHHVGAAVVLAAAITAAGVAIALGGKPRS